jgi:hypothetical protein
MHKKYTQTDLNKVMTVGNFNKALIQFESLLVESTKRKYDKENVPVNASQLKKKKMYVRDKIKKTYQLSVYKFFKKDRQIDETTLFLENLLKEFQDELRDLLPIDNNGGRFPDDDFDRVSNLKSMIKVVENIIEFFKSEKSGEEEVK